MSIKGKIRKNFLDKYSKYSIDSEKNFIYFPLHQDEEESTLVGAPFFTNQIELIKNIIKSLPVGYKLFVKESPSNAARDWRRISDYKKLLDFDFLNPQNFLNPLHQRDCHRSCVRHPWPSQRLHLSQEK